MFSHFPPRGNTSSFPVLEERQREEILRYFSTQKGNFRAQGFPSRSRSLGKPDGKVGRKDAVCHRLPTPKREPSKITAGTLTNGSTTSLIYNKRSLKLSVFSSFFLTPFKECFIDSSSSFELIRFVTFPIKVRTDFCLSNEN